MVRARLFVLLCFFWGGVHDVIVAALSSRPEESGKCATDASTCDEPAADGDAKHKTVSSPWAFMQAFSKLGTSWSHVIGEYKSVVSGADGVDLKGDVYAQDMDGALEMLQLMVQGEALALRSTDDDLSWSFDTTPLSDFGKTVDDLMLAFLRWSVVDNNTSQNDKSCQLIGGINEYTLTVVADKENTTSKINVSKAFRRLTSYVHWMRSVSAELMDPPVTYESISPSLSTFSIQVTHDACGRMIWWVNLGKTDMSAFKSQSPRETTRLFVWVAHLLFLDEGAQIKGLVVIDDMSEIGFWEYMTMLPIQVGISVDRFLISVTPLKAKNVVLMHLPKWAEIGYGLLSWFLTAKMRSRVTMVAKGEDIETLKKVVGGLEFIPEGFGSYGGKLNADVISLQHDMS